MNNVSQVDNTAHLTPEHLKGMVEKKFLFPGFLKRNKHLDRCPRCAEYVTILEQAKRIAGKTKPLVRHSHPSIMELRQTLAKICEQDLSPQAAADFLGHLTTCPLCFEYVGGVLKTALSPLPQPIEQEAAVFSTVSLADMVLERVPPRPEPEPEPNYIFDELKNRVQQLFDTLRLRPTYGLAIVTMIIILVFVAPPAFKNWRTSVHTKAGFTYLLDTWNVTDEDLRPPGNFQPSLFSIPHGEIESDPARKEFQAALSWNNDHRAARIGLATYWYFRGDLARCDSLVQTLLAQDSFDFEAWNLRGLLKERQEESSAALAAFEKALQIKPDYAEAAYNRALVLQRLERMDEAREAWQAYLKIDNSSDWAKEVKEHLASIHSPNN